MTTVFSSFTTIFFFLVTLIIAGIIFEKQLIALEDKFDAWFSKKIKSSKNKPQLTQAVKTKSSAQTRKAAPSKDSKYRGFAA